MPRLDPPSGQVLDVARSLMVFSLHSAQLARRISAYDMTELRPHGMEGQICTGLLDHCGPELERMLNMAVTVLAAACQHNGIGGRRSGPML